MCLVPEENQQPILVSRRFSDEKVAISIVRETKTHILLTKTFETIANLNFSNTIILKNIEQQQQ